ncbi:epoxyqueuosine reductase [Clostridiaceae bacterium 35-E11]
MRFHQEIFIKNLKSFVQNHPMNTVKELDHMILYDDLIVGFVSTNDPLFEKFKDEKIIGEHHFLPNEWLLEGKTVISYFLSFSEKIRTSNHIPSLPSSEWLFGRIEGDMLNMELSKFILQELYSIGEKSIAPSLDPRFKVVNRKSNWSERHVGFAAGLGTFGLSESFITELGAAGRMGSVITSLEIPPSTRPYTDAYEYCLWYRKKECGHCMKRCPVNAITSDGKIKTLCSAYLDMTKKKFAPRYGCGKCQTNVVCENINPVKLNATKI